MRGRITLIRRPTTTRGKGARRWLAAVVAAMPLMATATDLPPEVVADFTRRVQPLVLNRCAAGACHGGGESPEPRFVRRDPRGGMDRRGTLANMQAFLLAVGPDRDAGTLAILLASRHPSSAKMPSLVAPPLSPHERATLDGWLAHVKATERVVVDPSVQNVSAVTAPQPNRFKNLLDSAANPPQFPPPQEPQGAIFPKDVVPAE
jgi:hypothetical protein